MFKSLTVNRANWSGATGKIEYSDAGVFLIQDVDGLFSMSEEIDKYDNRVFVVRHKEYGVYKGYPFNSTKGEYVIFADCGVERSHQNPLVAFGRLAWSLF